jgi:nucleoid DNA-binding protein
MCASARSRVAAAALTPAKRSTHFPKPAAVGIPPNDGATIFLGARRYAANFARNFAGSWKSRQDSAGFNPVQSAVLALVVTLKHIAAEIAEAHEVPKTRARTMLADTVDRLAKHLVKGNKVRIVGFGIFQVIETRSADSPQSADRRSGEDQGYQEGPLPRRQGIEAGGLV